GRAGEQVREVALLRARPGGQRAAGGGMRPGDGDAEHGEGRHGQRRRQHRSFANQGEHRFSPFVQVAGNRRVESRRVAGGRNAPSRNERTAITTVWLRTPNATSRNDWPRSIWSSGGLAPTSVNSK